MIALDVNAYGTYARASAAADFAELWVSRYGRLSQESLADWLRDLNGVEDVLRDHFVEEGVILSTALVPEGSLGAESDASLEAAGRVFSVLEERQSRLRRRYPFIVRAGTLERRTEGEPRSPYMALLYITTCHAYSIDASPFVITDLFEAFVESALISRSLNTGGVSAARRKCGSFLEAIAQAGEECGIRVPTAAGVYRLRAQDESVDVLARVNWQDDRPLHWMFLIQATCAKSNRWSAKIAEPATGQWRELLGLYTTPKTVLAVPHHITNDTLTWLTAQRRECLVLDRLALSSDVTSTPIEQGALLHFAQQIEVAR